MALGGKQVVQLLKMRALGFSQSEIAEVLDTSQQVIAYKLKKLKQQAENKGTDEVFNSILIGGMAGASTGLGVFALLELINELEK
jgi:transcriptional regulator